MPDTVVVPVFVTRNDQTIVSVTSIRLSAFTSVMPADLTRLSAGAWLIVVSVDEVGDVTGPPCGF